jgi:hypothetical protein
VIRADSASAIRALLAGAIDYAGLFPPAALGMSEAVKNFAAYRRGVHAWALGRFIAPAAKLGEFSDALAAHRDGSIWEISALAGNDLAADLAAIDSFNKQHADHALVDTLELKAANAKAIDDSGNQIAGRCEAFYEIPFGPNEREMLEAIARVKGHAKIRTGGVTAEAFPSPDTLATFLEHCAAARLSFKATAGLHHPVRGAYRLTYEPASPSATMHGFLNVFFAAAFAHSGWPAARLVDILNETAPEAFQFNLTRASWRDQKLAPENLHQAHANFSLSFGSCSFEEPIADLQKLGWL